MKYSLGKWVSIVLLLASVFISIVLIEATVLAHVNQFKTVYIYLSLIPAFIAVFPFFTSLRKDSTPLSNTPLLIITFMFIVSFILIVYPHDTFGGADQAIYANLGSHLANSSSFKISSYLNNLPGNYVESIRTWYPGYPVWLGIQSALFGEQWMLRSNAPLIILGLFSFYLVSTYLGGNKVGIISSILLSSSMPFLWFSRETMSENLSFFLLWSIILFLLLSLKTKNHIYLIPVFICSWLFGLTRFEGFLLQFVLLFTLFPLLLLYKINFRKILVIITIGILVLVSNIYVTKDIFIPIFFNKFIPAVVESIKRDTTSFIPKKLLNTNSNYSISEADNNTLFQKLPFFYFQMMVKYNFILVIFSIFVIGIQFFVRIKTLNRSKKFFFVILLLFIPEYYKLISPNVTLTQPWLYRRYMYALLPLGYLCFSLLLNQLSSRKMQIIIAGGLLLINIMLSSPILFLKDNWLLVDKIEEMSKNISQQDLVLIDYRSPLKNYDIRTFFIVQKGVRTLLDWQTQNNKFIPERNTLNDLTYDKIFYLSAFESSKISFPLFRVVKIKEVDVHYSQLIPSCQLNILGTETGLANPYNIGRLSYSSAEKYCNLPTNEIAEYSNKLYLYQLIYNGNYSDL